MPSKTWEKGIIVQLIFNMIGLYILFMERKNIEEKILEIVKKSIGAENEEICFDEDLREHGMDSINCIMIIVEIEYFYQFEFADEDLILENFKTINRLVDYVIGKIDN